MKGRKGTYTKRGENKYRFQYMYKGQRYSETIECNSKRVETELALWINNIEKGSYYNSDYTFYEFAQVWLREVVKPNSSPTTLRRYLSILNNRVFPVLGTYKLTDISPILLNKYFVELKQSKTMYTNRENTTISKGTFDKVITPAKNRVATTNSCRRRGNSWVRLCEARPLCGAWPGILHRAGV